MLYESFQSSLLLSKFHEHYGILVHVLSSLLLDASCRLEFNFATWADFAILMFKGAGNQQRSFLALELIDGELWIAYNFETADTLTKLIAPCANVCFTQCVLRLPVGMLRTCLYDIYI